MVEVSPPPGAPPRSPAGVPVWEQGPGLEVDEKCFTEVLVLSLEVEEEVTREDPVSRKPSTSGVTETGRREVRTFKGSRPW